MTSRPILPALFYAVYQVGYLVYKRGFQCRLRLFIFVTAIYFMVVAVAIPQGRPVTYLESGLRYSSWAFGFVGSNLITFSWARIVSKICRLRYIRVVHIVGILHSLAILALCLCALVYMGIRHFGFAVAVSQIAQYGVANIIVIQAILLFAYGVVFLQRIQRMPMSDLSRRTLIRLTVLVFCVGFGSVLNLGNWYITLTPRSNPVLIAVRNMMFSFFVFFGFGVVFYFLRLREQRRTSVVDSSNLGSDHVQIRTVSDYGSEGNCFRLVASPKAKMAKVQGHPVAEITHPHSYGQAHSPT
ncbi:hypothetical protein IWQ60_010248 [Tieghemiomyces parasiticus]|uniref:Uncharacterized protein n=1 Tax=Tieghemiomyces parasiticus TaxID=78921 RepID=A0A9W7ZS08_9FUNG|nr:hypothetical protein IWQ60_010248 [Tieghemiomyces parasiticus]